MNIYVQKFFFRALLLAPLFFLFLFIVKLSQCTPLWADDYTASLDYDSFWHFLIIQKRIYFGWTGRFSPLFINYLLLAKEFTYLSIINILNGIVFVLLIYGIFLNSQLRKPKYLKDIAIFIFIFSLVWVYIPFFAEVTLWKTGTMFYLWPTVANLYFVYPFIQLAYGKIIFKDQFFSKAGMFICGFLVAGGMEYVSAALSFIFICFMIYKYWKKTQLPKWSWFATAGYWLGAITLIIAPGNYVRRSAVVNIPFSLFDRIVIIYNSIYDHYIGVDGLLMIAVIVAMSVLLLNRSYKNMFVRHLVFFFAFSLLSAFALIGSPIPFEGRVTFASDIFFITAIVSFFSALKNKNKYFLFCSLLCFVYILPSLLISYKEQKNILEQTKEREQLISFYHRNNIEHALLSPYFYEVTKSNYNHDGGVNTKYLYLADISSNPTFTVNNVFSRYYGFKTAVLMKQVILPWSLIKPHLDNTKKNEPQFFLKDNYLYSVLFGSNCAQLSKNKTFSLQAFRKDNQLFKNLKGRVPDNEWSWKKKDEVLTISDHGDVYLDRCIFRKKLNEIKFADRIHWLWRV